MTTNRNGSRDLQTAADQALAAALRAFIAAPGKHAADGIRAARALVIASRVQWLQGRIALATFEAREACEAAARGEHAASVETARAALDLLTR